MFRPGFFHKNDSSTQDTHQESRKETSTSSASQSTCRESAESNRTYSSLFQAVSSNIDPKPWEMYESVENELNTYLSSR